MANPRRKLSLVQQIEHGLVGDADDGPLKRRRRKKHQGVEPPSPPESHLREPHSPRSKTSSPLLSPKEVT